MTLAILVAACGAGSAPVTGQGAPGTTGGSSATTSPAPGVTTPQATASGIPATTNPTPDGPAAPDFTLALGDGGTYTLSEGAKPVYLVFWAEW